MAERPLGTVLVTGGASGLGAATALAVAGAGGRALVLDRVAPPPEVAQAVADVELVDLADARAAEAAVRAVADRAGGLDAVFTPAGTDRCGTLAEVGTFPNNPSNASVCSGFKSSGRRRKSCIKDRNRFRSGLDNPRL